MTQRDGETPYYLATVWVDDDAADRLGARPLAHTRRIIRYRAFDVEDYRTRVRQQFGPAVSVTFGPIGLSRRQT